MTTPWRGYPRVGKLDEPDGRAQINQLAMAVDRDVAMLSRGYRLAEVVYYTSSGTFQKGQWAGLTAVVVECVGGGGGSAYMGATGAGEVIAACGGSGGAFTRTWIDSANLLSSEVVTVGAGGIAGDSDNPDGGNGSDTSFGSHVTAGGGFGGSASPFGTGGEAWPIDTSSVLFTRPGGGSPSGTYDIGVRGEGGGGVVYQTVAGDASGGYVEMSGVPGGSSGGPYGATGEHGFATNPVNMGFTAFQTAGIGIGGGANGGYLPESTSAHDGAAGADGIVIVYVYVGVGTDASIPATPVVSVNGQSGVVTLDAAADGALAVTGGVVTGDLTISDPGVKGYQLRRSGEALDLDGTGKDLFVSVFSGPAFDGMQRVYLRLESAAHIATTPARWRFADDADGNGLVLDVDPANDEIGFFGAPKTTRPVVSGSLSGDLAAVVASLLSALDGLGLIDDQTTA